MPNCKCCGKPVINGVVLHSECYDRLAKDTNVPDKNVGEWISVEERLPEFGERVLVCGRIDDFGDEPEYGIDIAYRYHAGVEHIDFYWDSTFDVTHWMPLPVHPQEVPA